MPKAKKQTVAEFNRVLNHWIEFLNLKHWEIDVDFDEFCEDKDDAEINISQSAYPVAEIKPNKEWRDWDEKELNRNILHELLHIHSDKLKNAAYQIEGALRGDALHLYKDRYEHEEEHMVECLTQAITNAVGYA